MQREIKVLAVTLFAVFSWNTGLADRPPGNGAAVGKGGYLLNVIAFEQCPAGDFEGSNRHMIAVQANYTGNGVDKTSKTNKIFLKAGDFRVWDGNACDDGAQFYLPVDGNCLNCDDPSIEPVFTEYEVYARVVGKPGGQVTVTSCVEYFNTDTEQLESLCSVGADNVYVGLRQTGGGKLQNKWDNVSTELLTVCIDTSGDGICDQRIGLFDAFGEDYWWNWDTEGRPHVQLVFIPVS